MKAFENHENWVNVKEVYGRLRQAGFEALLAGGCVRDLLMNRAPNDFDIATNARPEDVEALFAKTVAVGKAFGVMIVAMADGEPIEVATFREDQAYVDGRRPESVVFSSAEEDAKRRDFTVNALFYDLEKKEVLDFVGGLEDLKNGVLRTVGVPEDRFAEDKLRLLRAVRFAAQLNFQIEEKTFLAIQKMAPTVLQVSRERIRDELHKLLKCENRVLGLKAMKESGLLQVLFPQLAKVVQGDTLFWLGLFENLKNSNRSHLDDCRLLLSLFLSPLRDELETIKDILKNLRLETSIVRDVQDIFVLLRRYLSFQTCRKGELILSLLHPMSKRAEILGDLVWPDHDRNSFFKTLLRDGGYLGTQHPHDPEWVASDRIKPAALLTGEDLLALGAKAGPLFKETLQEAYFLQLESALTQREQAIEWAKDFLQNKD